MSKSAVSKLGDVPESNALPEVPELTRLRLHNLILQQLVCREQLNGLVLQFLQTSQPKELQVKIDNLTGQINEIAAGIYSSTGLDPKQYQFNVEQGVFVARNGVQGES